MKSSGTTAFATTDANYTTAIAATFAESFRFVRVVKEGGASAGGFLTVDGGASELRIPPGAVDVTFEFSAAPLTNRAIQLKREGGVDLADVYVSAW